VLDPLLLAAHRLHRPGALRGLGEPRGDAGERCPLAEIGLRRPVQVPPGAQPQRGHGDQGAERDQRAGEEGRADGQDGGEPGDQDLGHRVAHGTGEHVHVGGHPGEQVPRAGRLHRRQRQVDDPLQEVLAQLGEDQLSEHQRQQPRGAGEQRLREDAPGEHQRHGVDVAGGRPGRQVLHETADQAWPGEPGDGREGVQPEGSEQGLRVGVQHRPGVAAHLAGGGDRQRGHAAPPCTANGGSPAASSSSAPPRTTTSR